MSSKLLERAPRFAQAEVLENIDFPVAHAEADQLLPLTTVIFIHRDQGSNVSRGIEKTFVVV